MKQRTKTGNARNRVKAGAGDLSKGLLRRLRQLEQANQDLTVQFANALERIGVLELCLWGGGPRSAQDVIAKQHEAAEHNRVFEELLRAAGGTVVYGPDHSYSAERYLAETCASAAMAAINDIEFPSAPEISRSITGLSPRRAPFWRRVFSAESGGKLLTIARAGVLLALFLVLLGLGVAIGHAAAAVLRGGG